MAIDAGQGFIDILPRTDKFLTSLNAQVSKAVSAATSGATSASQTLAKGATLGIVALGTAAVIAIGKGIQATTEWAGEVRTLIRVTGQSAESASGLAAASQVLGIGVDQLSVGFGLLAKNIVNAAPNLTKYGIAVKDANGNMLGFDEVLGRVQDKFATLQPGAEQAAFAMNVFGRSGKALIPILARGRDGLKELTDAAEAAGLVLSADDLEAARQLSIAQREFGEAFKGASIAIGKSFIPVVTEGVQAVTQFVEVLQKLPAPVLETGLRVAVLAAGLTAVVKVGQFFTTTWAGVLAKIAATPAAAQAVVASETEVAAATNVTTTSIEAQIAALRELAIARSAPVPIPALGFAGIVAPILAFAEGLRLANEQVKALRAGDPVGFFKQAAQAFNEFTGAHIDLGLFDRSDVESFRSGVEVVRSELLSGAITADEATEAVDKLRKEFHVQGDTDALVAAMGEVNDAINATDQAIQAAGVSIDGGAAAFGRLAAISGEASDEFRDSFSKAFSEAATAAAKAGEAFDGTAAAEDAFAVASADAMDKAAAAIADFRDNATGDLLGFTNDALGELADSTHLSVDKVITSFKDAAQATRDFGKDVLEISRNGGEAGDALAQQLLAAGPAAAGLADFIAGASEKARDRMIAAFGAGGSAADKAASKITKSIVGTLDVVKRLLEAIAKRWSIDVVADTGKAKANLDFIRAQIADIEGVHRTTIQISREFRGGGGHAIASGGIIAGASGFITNGPTFLTGESSKMTFAGRGSEAVIPFDSHGIGILSEALSRAMDKGGTKGGDSPDIVVHVHQHLDGKEVAESVTRHQQRGRMVRG